MKFARILDGAVSNIIELPYEPTFPATEAALWREISETAALDYGWTANADGTFSAPVAPSLSLAAYANQKQWELATGGYTVAIGGKALTFSTDPQSMMLINAKWSRLQAANPPTSINWQFTQGAVIGFVAIAAADFTPAAIEVADFVQATFDAVDVVEQQVAAGTIKTPADVDAYAWPSNASAVSA